MKQREKNILVFKLLFTNKCNSCIDRVHILIWLTTYLHPTTTAISYSSFSIIHNVLPFFMACFTSKVLDIFRDTSLQSLVNQKIVTSSSRYRQISIKIMIYQSSHTQIFLLHDDVTSMILPPSQLDSENLQAYH